MNNAPLIIYQAKDGKVKIETHFKGETVWLPQAEIAQLFGVQVPAISKHLKNIFESKELDKRVVVSILENTTQHGAIKGKTQNKKVKYYNLDAVLSVGYRVNSYQATQFRIWATALIKEYLTKGFVLNDERFKSGNSMNYFDELQDRIREIRISEKLFYQKIKDIYTTSVDYNSADKKTVDFFKLVQNKLLWAISQKTAAELVYRRADAQLPLMGMLSYDKENVTIKKAEVSIAKNYLNQDEMALLGLLVEQYLAFAETMAQQKTLMTMKDWADKLDNILQLNGREILTNAGKISHQMALEKSNTEYKEFKVQQKKVEKEQSLQEIEADIKRLSEGK